MKRILILSLVLVLSLCICACQSAEPTESCDSDVNGTEEYKTTLIRNLTASEDVSNIETFKIEYTMLAEPIFITDKNDLKFLKEYTYGGYFPTDRLHELYVYPPYCLITVNEETKLYLLEDGSIAKKEMCGDSGVPESEVPYEIYTADDQNMLTEKRLNELLIKYSKNVGGSALPPLSKGARVSGGHLCNAEAPTEPTGWWRDFPTTRKHLNRILRDSSSLCSSE